MIELYFGIKLIGAAIIIGLLVLIFLSVFIKSLISAIKIKRIDKYLTSIGYERKLIDTATFGNNHTYGYRRSKNEGLSNVIRDHELQGMSLKQVKQKYK